VLGYWLSRSRWSFRQLQELTQWATGEARPLHSSAIAHVRNGNLRQPGFKIFEALDAVNLAVDDWQQHGADFCTQRYGPLPRNIAPSDLEGAIVLQHPATQEPITLCDWFLIFCGRLQLPCADTISITPSQAPDASTKLLAMIDDAIAPKRCRLVLPLMPSLRPIPSPIANAKPVSVIGLCVVTTSTRTPSKKSWNHLPLPSRCCVVLTLPITPTKTSGVS
jgi:hypothetical protein